MGKKKKDGFDKSKYGRIPLGVKPSRVFRPKKGKGSYTKDKKWETNLNAYEEEE